MSFQRGGGGGAGEDVAQDLSLSRNSTSISNACTPVHTRHREYRERETVGLYLACHSRCLPEHFQRFIYFAMCIPLPLFIFTPVFGNFRNFGIINYREKRVLIFVINNNFILFRFENFSFG